MLKLRYAAIAALALSTSAAYAASDGTLGDTSSGSSDISVTIPDQVLISGVSDLSFGTLTANDLNNADGVSQSADVCVYSNVGADQQYTVTASGDGTASAFTVTDGTNVLTYAVSFSDSTGGGGTALSATTESGAFSAAGVTATDCGGAKNASFEVSFSQADLQAALAGTYTGTLTLLVSPYVGA